MHFAENASVSGVHHKPTHVVRFRKRTAVFRYNQLRIASKGNLPSCLKKCRPVGGVPIMSVVAEVSCPQRFSLWARFRTDELASTNSKCNPNN